MGQSLRFFKRIKGILTGRERGCGQCVYLFFVGYPRSGSTMLGQIINLHPNCIMANEARVLDNVIRRGASLESEMIFAREKGLKLFSKGLHKDDPYRLSIFQPKWRETTLVSKSEVLKKADIRVLGDKKAGSTSLLYEAHGSDLLDLVSNNERVRFIKISRNINDVAQSYSKSHPHEVRGYEDAKTRIQHLDDLSESFLNCLPEERKYTVRYEDLLESPEEQLVRMFGWLDVSTGSEIINKLSSVISK